MTEPEWLDLPIVLDAHAEHLAIFGGLDGVRDMGLLESALARARNQHEDGETDLCSLAAAYGFGITRNHPFLDGNKRTAFTAVLMFLGLNGFGFTPPPPEATAAMLALAAGEVEQDAFAAWIRRHVSVRAAT